MTNIMGFNAGAESYIYLCSDSQSTGEEKTTAQKLFIQGNNAFTGTGRADYILSLRRSMLNLQDPTPKQISELMLEKGKELKLDRNDPRHGLLMLVAGVEDGKPALYHVSVSGTPDSEPYCIKTTSSFEGSGRHQTVPAIERDIETGNIAIFDTTEGMNLCFSLGDRAGRNMYVDDKFQIALVMPNGIRALYHPKIDLGSNTGIDDYLNYFRTNFGLDLTPDKLKEHDYERINDIYAVMNDLYSSLLVTCGNMNHADRRVNYANTLSKVDRTKRDSHDSRRTESMKERDIQKAYTAELLNAWISGNLDNIVATLDSYREQRVERYENAQRYILGMNGINPQLVLPLE